MDKLDKIIHIIREMMVANPPGSGGGFGTESDPKGPVAGRTPKMFGGKVLKRHIYGGKNSRKNWIDHLNSKGK
jgi:hypothetical protein